MKRKPTDRKILQAIFDEYRDTYDGFDKKKPGRQSREYVPIDVERIAASLGVDKNFVFSRLLHGLERRHGYTRNDGAKVPFFAQKMGTGPARELNCIRFPLLVKVLADLQEKHAASRVKILALGVSCLSLGIALAYWGLR